MSSPTSIEDLPVEMIGELFKHLQLKDLAACSLVNRRWHSIYTDFKVHRLVITGDDYHLRFNQWSYPDRRVEQFELCRVETFSRLANQPVLSNLKHLAFNGLLSESYRKFDLKTLNHFKELVQLEFNSYLAKKKVDLNLPKLKNLTFHLRNDCCPLTIDCPELSVLNYREDPGMNLLKLKHPETIRRLETDMIDWKLRPFKKLESLVTVHFKAIKKATLLSLPELKELHFNAGISEPLFRKFTISSVRSLDAMRQALKVFLDDVEELKGLDFKFTFAGFLMTPQTLDQFDFGMRIEDGKKVIQPNEYVYMKNLPLVDSDATLQFINGLDYTCLMSYAPEQIPGDFFRKFTRVQSVMARVVQDKPNFLQFLKSLSSLRRLDLEDPQFNQEFYDQLPVSAHSLEHLNLLGASVDGLESNYGLLGTQANKFCGLNFDFIGKFNRLTGLVVFHKLTIGSLDSLRRSSGKLVDCFIRFRLKEKNFFIRKDSNSKLWKVFEIHFDADLCGTFNIFNTCSNSLNDLVYYLFSAVQA